MYRVPLGNACVAHPATPAEAHCQGCGVPACTACVAYVDMRSLCSTCAGRARRRARRARWVAVGLASIALESLALLWAIRAEPAGSIDISAIYWIHQGPAAPDAAIARTRALEHLKWRAWSRLDAFPDLAAADFRRVLSVDPADDEAKMGLAQCERSAHSFFDETASPRRFYW
jgi:hypothetical protein